MVCVGIDVAKDKHDCFILSSEGEVLADVFTIQNNAEGFNTLLQTILLYPKGASTHGDGGSFIFPARRTDAAAFSPG